MKMRQLFYDFSMGLLALWAMNMNSFTEWLYSYLDPAAEVIRWVILMLTLGYAYYRFMNERKKNKKHK